VKWFKKIKELILENSQSRQVKAQYQVEGNNIWAEKVHLPKLSHDNRTKEWVAITPTVNDENSELIISKILSRTAKKLIVEHWKISNTYGTGNLILEKGLGCKHNQNRAYEGCEKLYYEKEILGSLSGFIRKRGNR